MYVLAGFGEAENAIEKGVEEGEVIESRLTKIGNALKKAKEYIDKSKVAKLYAKAKQSKINKAYEKYEKLKKYAHGAEASKDVLDRTVLKNKEMDIVAIVKDEMDAISMVDPTGIASAVNAYTFPLCSDIAD